jgi:ATP-dependent Clp protease ATP-binding subunit ClpC
MDEGTLTDGKGRTVNFKNTVLVMTSNIGSRGILEKSREPLSAGADAASQTEETTAFVKSELEQAMKPELLNRIDEIIVFNPLSYDNLMEISNNMLDAISKRAADDQNIRVSVANNIAEIVTRTGFAAEFGARPIRRAAKRYLEDTLAEAIIRDFIQEGDQVSVDLVRDLDAVEITNLSANGSGDKTLIVPVDGDAGIGAQSAQQWQRLNGLAPSLDDDDDALPQEPDGFQ